MNYKTIITELKSCKNPSNIAGMARFGINSKNTLGVSMPIVRKMAKEIGKDHKMALKLWDSKIHEARILAGLIDEPALVTEKQMEKWVKGFDSWDVCDQVCMNLFDKTELAWTMPFELSKRKEEFVKRTGFALMAALAFHDKTADDKKFLEFFPTIKREATDERNFVRKAVNWALRQIGKRNKNLCHEALKLAREIQVENPDNKTAKWIAGDAIRELDKKTFL
ncbi:MAG: DNA alkylation repair protein [Candidatus Woesebacteria bacterium]|nr:DNA alkylation repair protein [Candidatus Woesebacteria bacterium]